MCHDLNHDTYIIPNTNGTVTINTTINHVNKGTKSLICVILPLATLNYPLTQGEFQAKYKTQPEDPLPSMAQARLRMAQTMLPIICPF